MDAEIFVNRIIDALENDDIWIFLVRCIVFDCSDSFLDFTESTKKEIVGRDIINNTLYGLPNEQVVVKKTEPYKLFFNAGITKTLKSCIVKPTQYKDYRFSVIIPHPDNSYEDNIRSPETYQETSSLKSPLEGT